MGDWGAAAVGSLATALLVGAGAFAVKLYRARGGFAKDVAAATVIESQVAREREDAARLARREQEETDRDARREQEAAERRGQKNLISDQREAIESLKADRAADREEIHGLRETVGILSNKLTACQIELAVCKTELASCRADHKEQTELNRVIVAALHEAGIKVLVPGASGTHRPLPGDGS
jgi:hypothetical protein